MKNIIIFTLLLPIYSLVHSQCVPDAQYSDSTWGIWPDTAQNFISGNTGVYYEQIVNFKLPSDAGALDPIYDGYTLDSVS